jgi:hypothetical protein
MSGAEKLKLEEFATSVLAKIDAQTVEEAEGDGGGPSSHDLNWASEMSHPCDRFLTYSRLNFSERRDKSNDMNFLYRILAGKKFEIEFRHLVEETGAEIVLQQKRFEWKKFEISGRVDGMIQIGRPLYPLEVKFINPRFFDQISDIESIKSHRSYWIHRLLTQLNLYQLMADSEFGFLGLGTPGRRPKLLVNPLDLEIGERAIKKTENVNAHVKKKTYPDRIPYSDLCELCDYNALCSPMKISTTDVIDEEELKPFIRTWIETRDSSKRFKKADEEIKKRMRGHDAIIENVEITTTEYMMTKMKLPEDVKAQFSFKEKAYRVDITPLGE